MKIIAYAKGFDGSRQVRRADEIKAGVDLVAVQIGSETLFDVIDVQTVLERGVQIVTLKLIGALEVRYVERPGKHEADPDRLRAIPQTP